MMLLVGGFSRAGALAICALVSAGFAALALRRARRVPAVISAASAELAVGELASEAGNVNACPGE
jgi:hypothetical protein